ncbi:MAG: respiratory nitrate reductase subunit gamma [Deltaproteobacteria bacterium]|nr:respiratory nitrate reductase subunit gamma [Deltaproteobacteria bacterium]
MLDFILFATLPYVVIAIELIVSIKRYFSNQYKFSSLSSEFLESKKLFWGSVPWHYGIIVVLLGHIFAFLFPAEILAWNQQPVRLIVLEVSALIFGLLAFIGLVMLIYRRATNARVRAVTTRMDIFVLLLLLVQVVSGIGIAVTMRWGSSWYAVAMVPYLKSLLTLSPNINFMAGMPWLVKLHVTNAFVLIGILPFTRLVHFLILPISYIWRPYQLIVWNYERRKIRNLEKKF